MPQSETERLRKRREYKRWLPEERKERERQKRTRYAQSHQADINRKARQYRKDHPEIVHARDKKKHEKTRQNPAKECWRQTRKRARADGIPFELEISDIIYPETCPILGIPLVHHIGKAQNDSPSLDRLIPSKGYVKGNCFIISKKANVMKQDNTLEDFEKIITYIKERLMP